MADQHVPDLNAIRTLPNPEIKFYAIIGAVISLGAALELLISMCSKRPPN
jgi:hypothetical protein